MNNNNIKPVHGVGQAATILIGLSAAFEVLVAVLDWFPSLLMIAEIYVLISWVSLVLLVVTGITFVVWMNQARLNSDVITSKHQHRWTNMWVFVGWIVPIANFFIPYAVMQDIWRGSDRTDRLVPLQDRPKSGLILGWWLTFLLSSLTGFLAGSDAQNLAVWSTISALSGVVAAVLAAKMIRQVNDLQVSEPNASPAPAA